MFISKTLGGVFAIENDVLISTPMLKDQTFDDNKDEWVEVDHMALLGEEKYILDEVNRIESILRANFSVKDKLTYGIESLINEYFQAQINECDDMGEISNIEEAKDALLSELRDVVNTNLSA